MSTSEQPEVGPVAAGRLVLAVVVLAVVAVLTAACSRPVSIPESSPGPEGLRLCRALHERLPDRLGPGDRRPTEPDSEFLAAWGSPPVALRCGVGPPAGLRPTSHLATVNGVDWLPEPADAPTRFTTVGRAVYVQVILPDGVSPADVLVDLAAPIKATLPPAEI